MNQDFRISRRRMLQGSLALTLTALDARARQSTPTSDPQASAPRMSYPIGRPGQVAGDQFYISHTMASENTWFMPGWWHTGDDWYALDEETAGANVYAVLEGTVVFAGYDYPGAVVIVEHDNGLFSQYGHLSEDVAVEEGDHVTAGETLGTVYDRTDNDAPSHLHFELRDFLFNDDVNGDNPQWDVNCGYQCEPGPGYWPQEADEHPVALGYTRPLLALTREAFAEDQDPFANEIVVADGHDDDHVSVREAPDESSEMLTEIRVEAGETFPVSAAWTSPPDSLDYGANAYDLWYEVELPGSDGGETGWVRGIEPSRTETDSDGQPAAVVFRFLPVPD